MVTSLTSTGQAVCISDTQKIENKNATEQNLSEADSSKNSQIEDSFILSHDFKGTGSEYYEKLWHEEFFRPYSVNQLEQKIKKSIMEDYDKQYPEAKIFQSKKLPTSLLEKFDSIDYKKEFKEYMQSRECENEEELRELDKMGMHTKTDLQCFAGATIAQMYYKLNDRDGMASAGSVVTVCSIADLVEFIQKTAGNKPVDAIQKAFEELMNKTKPKEPTPEEQAQAMREKYNSSLISKYAS